MKRTACIFSLILLFTGGLAAQSYEGNIQFDKKKQAAIVIEYSYPADAVENAFVERMKKMGFKPKEEKGFLNKDKGFLVFRNAYVTDISEKRLDYIVKVERKSRREQDESVLYLVMMENDENAISKMEAYDVGRAKNFLNTMLPDIEVAHLELQIKAQEEAVAKSEKKLRDLEDDYKELTKKIRDNEKSQEDTRSELESQRKTLDILINKRKKDDL